MKIKACRLVQGLFGTEEMFILKLAKAPCVWHVSRPNESMPTLLIGSRD